MKIGEKLRLSRECRGASQSTVAAALGCSPQRVGALEGADANPTWRTIERIAAALGMTTVEVVCTGERRMQP